MKRDLALIREILLIIEAQPAGHIMENVKIPGDRWNDAELFQHLLLMDEGGLIDAEVQRLSGGVGYAMIRGLTNAGHDLIDSIRDASVWQQTQEKVGKVGGSVALETVKAVAAAIVTKMLT